MNNPKDTALQVESLYRQHLDQAFQGSTKFDPIRVEPILDLDGHDSFHITIVYEGDQYLLDPRKLNAIRASAFEQLKALGFPNGVLESYVEKSEDSKREELLEPYIWEEDSL